MMKKLLTTLVMLRVFSLTPTLAVEYQSPRTLGLGGAGRAAPLLTDSIYLNPAYASLVSAYSLSFGYLWFDSGRNYNISIQDSRTELFQAGIGFTRREQNAVFNIGASRAVIDRLGFGLGTKVIVDDGTNTLTSDMLFSTCFIATQWMYASLIVDNLFESSNGLTRNLYRNFYVAFKFIPLKEIGFFLDPIYSPNYLAGNKAGFSVGAEFAMLADFFLRAGQFVNNEVTYLNTRGNGFGLGLGWVGPRATLEYAYQRTVSNDLGTGLSTSNSLRLSVFF